MKCVIYFPNLDSPPSASTSEAVDLLYAKCYKKHFHTLAIFLFLTVARHTTSCQVPQCLRSEERLCILHLVEACGKCHTSIFYVLTRASHQVDFEFITFIRHTIAWAISLCPLPNRFASYRSDHSGANTILNIFYDVSAVIFIYLKKSVI